MATSEGITWNRWEVANRTKKVNRVLAVLPMLPNTAEAITDGTLTALQWDELARVAGVIPCGAGARNAIRTILLGAGALEQDVRTERETKRLIRMGVVDRLDA